jgi:adenylate cyclase
MAVEIERKYLVTSDGWQKLVSRQSELRQGYLAVTDRASIRIRIKDPGTATLTVKSAGNAVARDEYEYGIPTADAEEMLTLCDDHVVEKTRYIVAVDGDEWEVDVYHGRHAGLVTAELELATAQDRVSIPSWVSEEVTGNSEYSNAALALHGLPRGH